MKRFGDNQPLFKRSPKRVLLLSSMRGSLEVIKGSLKFDLRDLFQRYLVSTEGKILLIDSSDGFV